MPKYIEDEQELVFPYEESEEHHCPVCWKHLSYDDAVMYEDRIEYPWTCPDCRAAGKAIDLVSFSGYRVKFSTLPLDMQNEYKEES